MNIINFIDINDVKEFTPMNFNVDDKKILLALYISQETYIKQALGSNLYKKISTLIDTDDINNITYIKYKELLDDYITMPLILWTLAKSLSYINVRFENKGVITQDGDATKAVDTPTLNYKIGNIQEDAEFKTQELIKHLIANSASYPEYMSYNSIEDLQPSLDAYFCGIQFEDDNYWNNYYDENGLRKIIVK